MVRVLGSAAVLVIAAFTVGLARADAPSSRLDRQAPRPHRGKSVVVTPKQGTVILFRRGNRKLAAKAVFLPLGHPVVVPLGSVVDTSAGKAMITSAISPFGTVSARGTFSRGVFAVNQTGSDTAISLGGNGSRECSRPRRLVSRAPGDFMVLAGASASRASSFRGLPSATPAEWVARDRCSAATIKTQAGRVEVVALGSRQASARRAHRLFGHGRFRTQGRNSSATVRGRAIAG